MKIPRLHYRPHSDDFCEDYRDVLGYDESNRVQIELHSKCESYKNRFDPLRKLWIRWLYRKVKIDTKKKRKILRSLLADELREVRIHDYYVKSWWDHATSPNERIIKMKIPGRNLRSIIDRIECETDNDPKTWYWVYRHVVDELERHYKNELGIEVKFISGEDQDKYRDYLRNELYPILVEKLKEIRGEIKI